MDVHGGISFDVPSKHLLLRTFEYSLDVGMLLEAVNYLRFQAHMAYHHTDFAEIIHTPAGTINNYAVSPARQ